MKWRYSNFLIAEISSRFGLGAKSSAFTEEVIRFMTSEPGGIAGFLDRLKNRVSPAWSVPGWAQSSQPMSTQQVESRASATSIINMIADKLGLWRQCHCSGSRRRHSQADRHADPSRHSSVHDTGDVEKLPLHLRLATVAPRAQGASPQGRRS